MSPLWRRRIVVGFAPDQVSVLRWGRGLRPSLEAAESIVVSSESPTTWAGAIDALAASLAAAQRADVDILLSNHFVHYAVLPPTAELKSDAQRQSLAGIVFGKRYGTLSQDWDIRISPAHAGEPALACGVPKALLAALLTAIPKGVHLRSLRPAFMNIFNRHRRSLNEGNACMAVVEAGRITSSWTRNGQWRTVVSRAVTPGDSQAAAELLREQIALESSDEHGVLWLCDVTGATALPTDIPWTVRAVPQPKLGMDAAKAAGGLACWGAN